MEDDETSGSLEEKAKALEKQGRWEEAGKTYIELTHRLILEKEDIHRPEIHADTQTAWAWMGVAKCVRKRDRDAAIYAWEKAASVWESVYQQISESIKIKESLLICWKRGAVVNGLRDKQSEAVLEGAHCYHYVADIEEQRNLLRAITGYKKAGEWYGMTRDVRSRDYCILKAANLAILVEDFMKAIELYEGIMGDLRVHDTHEFETCVVRVALCYALKGEEYSGEYWRLLKDIPCYRVVLGLKSARVRKCLSAIGYWSKECKDLFERDISMVLRRYYYR